MKNVFTLLFSLLVSGMFIGASAQISNYCSSNATSTGDTKIDNVTLEDINNNSLPSPCETYTDYTSISTSLAPGATYSISIKNGTCGSHYGNYKRAWIDFNANGVFDDPSERIIDAPVTTAVGQIHSATFTVPSNAAIGPTYMRVIARESSVPIPCGTYSWGETEDYSILIKSTAANDAGVASIDSPAGFCEGTFDIKATIKNFGINQINGVVVNWSLNGFIMTPINYTGLLDTSAGSLPSSALVTLGSNIFAIGVTDTIEVWTTMPNGVVDTSTANDSAYAEMGPRISGAYTIDANGFGAFNYLTIGDAVADLNQFGVCGPITFTMAPGVYSEKMDLGKVEGASSVNTISFLGDTSVKVEYGPTGSTDNGVLRMTGSEWYIIDGITFRLGAGGSTSYRNVGRFDGVQNNVIQNCTFNGYVSTSSSSNVAAIYGNDAENDFNKFLNNTITNGGYYGLYWRGGGTTAFAEGNEFIGNTFTDAYRYGAYFYYNWDLKFNNNTITTNTTYTSSSYGLYSYYGYHNCQYNGNMIEWPYYAMYIYYPRRNAATENGRGVAISNNMISAGKGVSSTTYGIYVRYPEWADIAHNNIWLQGSPTGTRYGFQTRYGNDSYLVNNIVYSPDSTSSIANAAFWNEDNATVCNNNNYWGPNNYGKSGTTYYDSLHNWQTTNNDTNSFFIDPMFTKWDSMYTCVDSLSDGGMPLVNVNYDIQGDDRSITNPSIGADEYLSFGNTSFNAGPDGILCNGSSVEIGSSLSGAAYLWSTGESTPKITVSTIGDYIVSMSAACGGTGTDTVNVWDNTPFATYTYENSYYTGIFTNTSTQGDDYMWVLYNDQTGGKTNPIDTLYTEHIRYWYFGDNGPYNVCLTTMNECDTVETCADWIGWVGIEENILNGISLMPNPVSDNLTIQFTDFGSDQVNIEMMNIQGQAVYGNRFVGVSGNDNRIIDVSNLKKGMYIMKFTTENNVATKRIIVQ